jgi:hypothetical protein
MQFIRLTYPLLSSSLALTIKIRALWLASSAVRAAEAELPVFDAGS